ncbi:hypothetical protein [Aliiglaciecola sp. LCG003]|uniref:hypothetical protein n=1 Tax=Aliiglaciecola sp. LCG003 TaxID=3053655 RepID=UPI002573EE47|nr:hypothetical protein [Aliiglaciecola sp. LCG003]WJG10106.1 hypothetical protein QR722_03440 [Aliiglaciecola sp. LCG003]
MISTKQFILLLGILLSCQSSADIIFNDDFQDGNFSGWVISGSGSAAYANNYAGNYSLRLRNNKAATHTFSTANFTAVSITTSIAAASLESVEQCVAQVSVDGGSNWTAINTVVNGQDDGVTLYTNSASPTGIDNNSQVAVRLKAQGNNNSDYCYFDDIEVSGTSSATPPSCDYDCLSGSGTVSRSELSYSTLQSAATGTLVDMSAFTLPSNAANPTNNFQGNLNFTAVVRGWGSVKDSYNYAAITDIKKLPDFSYEFVQHGSHLIPVDRGLQITSHYLWQLILEPGRVWDESADNGYSRASIPFALQEYGANCTHNGVLTFLFKSDGSMSKVAYEIASETCEYYQFNSWGRLDASYTPAAVTNAGQIKSDYEQEVSNRMLIKPLSALATDYPSAGLSIATLGSEQTAANRSAFGVAYNGVNYVADCDTRQGVYPYCEVMSLPSYSVAKSTFGAYGLMALEQLYSGAKNASVASYATGCSSSQWTDVSLENALDMATGNYTSAGFEVDEASSAMANGFFLDYTDSGKTSFSCSYTRQATPGTSWVYHSSDTYLLGKAMDQYLGQDTYNWLVDYLYKPLGLSPSTYTTVRTFDAASQAMAGFGLTYHVDDLVKLGELLNNDNGNIGGTQKLKVSMVDEVLQNTSYHGLNAGTNVDSYDNGFWIWKADAALGCSGDLYIPYMSGFGGIGVVLLPNNMLYYFVSDNNEHSFVNSVAELDKLGDFCN